MAGWSADFRHIGLCAVPPQASVDPVDVMANGGSARENSYSSGTDKSQGNYTSKWLNVTRIQTMGFRNVLDCCMAIILVSS